MSRHLGAYSKQGLRLLTFFDDAEHFVLAHDEVLGAIQLDLLTGVLPKEDFVTGLDVDRDHGAVVLHLAFPDGQDPALPFAVLDAALLPRCATISPWSGRIFE